MVTSREELMEHVKNGPVRILTHNGSSYDVPNAEFILASPSGIAVLANRETDSERLAMVPFVAIGAVEQ